MTAFATGDGGGGVMARVTALGAVSGGLQLG